MEIELSDEPIKVADMLISASETYYGVSRLECKVQKYSVSDLEQIAHHLLIYVNAKNEEEALEQGDE